MSPAVLESAFQLNPASNFVINNGSVSVSHQSSEFDIIYIPGQNRPHLSDDTDEWLRRSESMMSERKIDVDVTRKR